MRRSLILGLSGAVTAAAVVASPAPAVACGGFFCNAQTQSPIYQAGERVLFARTGDTVTMHVEVTYQGDPTEFAWILPVPDRPMDADGNPLPLDQAVGVSVAELFDTLQNQTDPVFQLNRTPASDYFDCQEPRQNFADATSADASQDASSWPRADADSSRPPPVAVLSEAKVGPYDAQLIEATGSDALFEWLNANGYYQDPKAKPLLAHYVQQGFKFIGVKLQSGKKNDDLKPLALRLGENAPCVPLRLTSIAATGGMPILVWVLGDGRAVPKNFIHAEVNPRALTWPGGQNYVSRVTSAVETAMGRAWVTEYAGSASFMRGTLLGAVPDTQRAAFENATTLAGLLNGTPQDLKALAAWTDLLRDEVPKPAGMTGYPYGDCYYGGWYGPGEPPCRESNSEHETTDAEFYGYLDFWAEQYDSGVLSLDVDLDRMREAIRKTLWEPAEQIESLFEGSRTLTRFYTTIDPEDMTRDPIFAFNASLPEVGRIRTVDVVLHRETEPDGSCGEPWFVATYPDGTTWSGWCGANLCSGTMPAAPGAPALKVLQVLDESGEPRPFDPEQAEEVDTVLDGAVVGTPSIPDGMVLDPPATDDAPIVDPTLPKPGGEPQGPSGNGSGSASGTGSGPSGGCDAGGTGTLPWLGAVLLMLLALRGRARRRV